MRDIDRFRGCLIGGAAGDALGYAVEFLTEAQIFARYGNGGIAAYEIENGLVRISDDTQMTLFTANGILLGAGRKQTSGIMGSYTDDIRIMYQCWYRTQTESYPIKNESPAAWLLNIPALFSTRAPGMTCLSAIRQGAGGTLEQPINQSKGCGGVMRVAPIGLYFCGTSIPYEVSDRIGAEAAALTHGHELGFIPAAALAHIIRAVTEKDITLKDAVTEAIAAAEKLFPRAAHLAEHTAILQKAVLLAESATDDLSAVHQLGEGWVAEETLAIAVYCALKYAEDFDKAICAAVNHNGDSDSTGAVCGNLLGAYLGYDAIPQKFKDRLELHDVILEIADDLCSGCKPYRDEVWERKYIDATYPG